MTKLNKQRRLFIVLSLIIPMALLIAFVVVPAVDLFRMSFTNWDGYSPDKDFIGFDNYIAMFKNKDLWMSLKNNAVYFVAHLAMIVVELAIAVVLTSKLKAAKFYTPRLSPRLLAPPKVGSAYRAQRSHSRCTFLSLHQKRLLISV